MGVLLWRTDGLKTQDECWHFFDVIAAFADYNDNTAPATLRIAKEYDHVYSTYTFTEKAVGIINEFSPTSAQPLFLYLPYQNVHWYATHVSI